MPATNFEPGARLMRLGADLENPTRALKQIGALMVAESQRGFVDQQFGGVRWPERAPVNVFGALADFAEGRSEPKPRRFDRRPALADSGRLRGSIAWKIVGSDVVEVGTNLPYAAVHQSGGETESVPITSDLRGRLLAWLRGAPRSLRRLFGRALARGAVGQRLRQQVPARPFVGITARTREAIRRVVGVEIAGAGR